MLPVYLIHGFRSRPSFMDSFVSEWKVNEIHLQTKIHHHNWFAGVPESKINTIIGAFWGKYEYASNVHKIWDEAVDNIDDSSENLAHSVNDEIVENGNVLFVAHSMGVEVVIRAISLIRKDINIYLFLMAGVSDDLDSEDAFKNRNVRSVYNFYSKDDFILNNILPEMNSSFFYPIGVREIDHDKVINISTKYSHSDYLKSRDVLNLYTKIVGDLVEMNN
ncbi:hypothetical protein ACULTK_001014 [Yersinia enterocolitica]